MNVKVVAEFAGMRMAVPEDTTFTLGDRSQPAYVISPDDSYIKTTVWVALKWGGYRGVPERTIVIADEPRP